MFNQNIKNLTPENTNFRMIVYTGSTDLKLFTVYSPPRRKDGTIHKTKEEAEEDENDSPEY